MKYSEILEAIVPAEYKGSTRIALSGVVGDSIEVGLLSYVESATAVALDLTKLSETNIREYLAFLGVPVRGVVPATLVTTVMNNSPLPYTFSVGDVVYDNQYRTWAVVETAVLQPYTAGQVVFKQTRPVTVAADYTDQAMFDTTGVVQEGVKLFYQSAEVQPAVQFANGYVAYILDTVTAVKIYPGVDTPNPVGQVVLTYNQSEGRLTVEPTLDVTALSPLLEIVSQVFSDGSPKPTQEQLVYLLKNSLVSKGRLVSRSDYADYVRSIPDISDVLCVGDTERYNYTGLLQITGVVELFCLGPDYRPITEALKSQVRAELEPIKDNSYLKFTDAEGIGVLSLVTASGVSDYQKFVQECLVVVNSFFQPGNQSNISVFAPLQAGAVVEALMAVSEQPETAQVYFMQHQTVITAADNEAMVMSLSYGVPERGQVKILRSEGDELVVYAVAEPTTAEIVELFNAEGVVVGNVNYTTGVVFATAGAKGTYHIVSNCVSVKAYTTAKFSQYRYGTDTVVTGQPVVQVKLSALFTPRYTWETILPVRVVEG